MTTYSDGVKEFLSRWIIPAAWLELRKKNLLPRTQKFWRGGALSAPPAEAKFFSAIGRVAHTITRRDDSRSAVLLEAGVTELPMPAGTASALQFAVTADKWHEKDFIRITALESSLYQTGLKTGHWLDMRLPFEGSADVFHVEASCPVYFSYPRRVNITKPGKPKAHRINHVLVLVLDGMTPLLETADLNVLPGGEVAPNIERFFSQGFNATNGWSTGEWTLPTTASFFTGLYTSRHGVHHPTFPTYLPPQPLLAEILQQDGFHTLGMSTANRLTPAYGSHRGFDRFIYHWPYPGHTVLDYDPARWCDEICGHLDVHRHDRSFIYAHFPDTHPSWDIPPLTRSFNLLRRGSSTGHNLNRLENSSYAKEQGPHLNMLRLHELDRQLGNIFDFVDRNIADETIVILTADHGTPWKALRSMRPCDEPYLVDQRTRVNLRMRGPGVPAMNFDRLCSPTIDLLPTILSRLDLPCPKNIDGQDLLNQEYYREWVVSESIYSGNYELAIRNGSHVYFEKYPTIDGQFKLIGPASYRRLFNNNEDNYYNNLEEDLAIYIAKAKNHINRVSNS